MALTLSSTLATAQDSQSRRPLAEIISSPATADIPFIGQFLTSESTNEQKPNVITHSSGRLCLLYNFGSEGVLKYVYTDIQRTTFTTVDLTPWPPSPYAHPILGSCLCELSGGNIGLIYICDDGATRYLRRMIISVTGDVVTADASIASYAETSYLIDMPFVTRLANAIYLLVYAHQTIGSPNTCAIMKRTSANFMTWGAESECSISNLVSTKPRYNPSLVQISTGDVWLWFEYRDDVQDDKELTNIYYSVSADNGSTWANAVKVTNYTTFGTIGKHPFSFQKVANQLYLLFHEQIGALHMDSTTTGMCGFDAIDYINFDSVNRKLYCVCMYNGNTFRSVFKVDVDNWSIENCWNCETTPGFNSMWCATSSTKSDIHAEGHLIPLASGYNFIALLDGEANTITEFNFANWEQYSLVQNVNWNQHGSESLNSVWVDESSNRMYCLFVQENSANRYVTVGYFDLTEIGEPHEFHEIFSEHNALDYMEVECGEFIVAPSSDFIISSFCADLWHNSYPEKQGHLRVNFISTAGNWKSYDQNSYNSFPWNGLHHAVFLNGKVYGSFLYQTTYGEQDKRGLCEVDLMTDVITYHRPSWATLDDYGLGKMKVTDDGKILIATYGHGITIFDPSNDTWEVLDSDSVPGLTPDGNDAFFAIDYDPQDQMIYSSAYASVNWAGLVGVNINGYIKRTYYEIAEYGGNWIFGTKNSLVQGVLDYEMVAALDPTDKTMFVFWTHLHVQELSIKWAKENSQFNLSSYLLMGSEIRVKRSIDGAPATLEFEVSHGHLFDFHNTNSLLAIYLRKFRKLTLRFGEKISGVDYWQQMGVFFVTETSVSYERPKYPSMPVKAEDITARWEKANNIATEYYQTYPETILSAILISYCGLQAGDISLPTFADRTTCHIQWIEQPIKGILEQICEHFGYYPRIDVNGRFTAKKISNASSVDHTYGDLTKIINFSPDDSFSDFTNQVIVKGESRDFMEVVYNEKEFQRFNGSMGWWGQTRSLVCWYSEDASLRARDPRFYVIESVKDGPFYCKDGNEVLYSIDPYEHYFVIRIYGPDLRSLVVTFLVLWLAMEVAAWYASAYDAGAVFGIIAAVFMFLVMQAMGTQANYDYQTFAKPVGNVRQSFQYVADDEELQTDLGMVVRQIIDDPLCYTLAACKSVAEFELMVAKYQRRRVKFSKLAHLQDEDGDMIQILHPYTNLPMKIFVTDLERVMRLPSSADASDGYFIDNIEGWNVT